MKKIGLLINPIAGMGGAVGLKGTDGDEILEEARRRGAHPQSELKSKLALESFLTQNPPKDYKFYCYSPSMGGNLCAQLDIPFLLGPGNKVKTKREDTLKACQWMKDQGVDLLVFAGGDGTARDILTSKVDLPVLGIPTGVKIHSSVFVRTPKHLGRELSELLRLPLHEVELREVMDIDEERFRNNRLSARLFGYLGVPKNLRYLQMKKSSGGVENQIALQGIAQRIIGSMEPEEYYFVGPGTSTKPILDVLGIEGSLLGVDILKDKKLVVKDAKEEDLLKILNNSNAKIIVSVIGGQGYIFGRGNQQFSPAVLRKVGKKNIQIIATAEKLGSLGGRALLMDLGDESLEKDLSGFYLIPVDATSTYVYPCDNQE